MKHFNAGGEIAARCLKCLLCPVCLTLCSLLTKRTKSLYDIAVTEYRNVWMEGASNELRLFDTSGNLQRSVNIKCHGFYICMFKKQVVFMDTTNEKL